MMKVDLLDVMGTDLTVVNAARVSYDNESFFEEFRELETGMLKRVLSDRDKKLIKFLAEHGHIIPFAHPQLSFRIHCPIFVMRQLDKTRVGLCVSEVSRRYISSIPDVYQPVSWRKKDKNKKQGSSKTETIVDLRQQGFKMQTVDEAYQRYVEHSLDLYKDMLDANICEEQARMVLPLGSYTTFIWTGSLLAFCRLVNLRLQDDVQEETAIIVRYILKFLKDKFPIASGQLTTSKINYEQWDKYYEQVGIED